MQTPISSYPLETLIETYDISVERVTLKKTAKSKRGQPVYEHGQFYAAWNRKIGGYDSRITKDTVREAVEAVVEKQ